MTVLDNWRAYIAAALEGMFPGIAVSSLPAFTVITISRCLGEMKLHSQLEGQPLWREIHSALTAGISFDPNFSTKTLTIEDSKIFDNFGSFSHLV